MATPTDCRSDSINQNPPPVRAKPVATVKRRCTATGNFQIHVVFSTSPRKRPTNPTPRDFHSRKTFSHRVKFPQSSGSIVANPVGAWLERKLVASSRNGLFRRRLKQFNFEHQQWTTSLISGNRRSCPHYAGQTFSPPAPRRRRRKKKAPPGRRVVRERTVAIFVRARPAQKFVRVSARHFNG